MTTPPPSAMEVVATLTPEEICDSVMAKNQSDSFELEHRNKEAPLVFIALAGYVVERILRNKNSKAYHQYFQHGTFTVPGSTNTYDNPQYHSIVGQKLLLVDWKKTHGIELACGRSNCTTGILQNDRTNFSKNKALFPVYMIDGPPVWCMDMSTVCSCCKRRINANDSKTLCRLPAFVAEAYPFDSKYALGNKNSHIG